MSAVLTAVWRYGLSEGLQALSDKKVSLRTGHFPSSRSDYTSTLILKFIMPRTLGKNRAIYVELNSISVRKNTLEEVTSISSTFYYSSIYMAKSFNSTLNNTYFKKRILSLNIPQTTLRWGVSLWFWT